MGFYRNTGTEIIKINPEISALNNFELQKPNVTIPVGSICSFDIRDFGYPSDDLNSPVVYLRCIKSAGDCIGCYFKNLPATFCPECCRDSRIDNSDVIFEEVSI